MQRFWAIDRMEPTQKPYKSAGTSVVATDRWCDQAKSLKLFVPILTAGIGTTSGKKEPCPNELQTNIIHIAADDGNVLHNWNLGINVYIQLFNAFLEKEWSWNFKHWTNVHGRLWEFKWEWTLIVISSGVYIPLKVSRSYERTCRFQFHCWRIRQASRTGYLLPNSFLLG